MKIKIVALLLAMFIVTQLLGLAVINAYSPHVETIKVGNEVKNVTVVKELPYGMEPPKTTPQNAMISIIIAIVLVTLIFFVLTKINANILIKIWFFSVVAISIAITLGALFSIFGITTEKLWKIDILAMIIAVFIASFKIFRPNFFSHNLSELLIYPGLAAVFVPILSPATAIILLLIISVYDMYAVWKSKFMVEMAKYQMQTLKVFNGFFVPYLAKKPAHGQQVRFQMAKSIAKKSAKKMKKQKVAVAFVGGGDIAFPLIFAGVILRAVSLPASLIIVGASTASLLFLFLFSKRGKAYPAMPFLTAGCLIGYLIALLLL
jgi:presenilin-like A22 family membrane protease